MHVSFLQKEKLYIGQESKKLTNQQTPYSLASNYFRSVKMSKILKSKETLIYLKAIKQADENKNHNNKKSHSL